ncbi:unnamed protein product, partial [Discosporangium mesarthrocarpum]
LVTEYCPNGELHRLAIKESPLPHSVTREYFRQLMTAVSHCHGKNFYHRDIKPENVLLDESFNLKV